MDKYFPKFVSLRKYGYSNSVENLTTLPLVGEDLEIAGHALKNEEEAKQFAYFIKELEVFPDHGNPKAIEQIENRNSEKTFFLAPFFQPSEERGIVGGQEIAEEGIKIIAEIYELLSSFDYELFQINQLSQEKTKKIGTLKKLRSGLEKQKDPLARASTENLINEIKNEIQQHDVEMKKLNEQAANGLNETSGAIKKQVINQIQLKLSFLGVIATSQESKNLQSPDAGTMRDGLTSIIARASSEGQYGYRTAIFEAGYSAQQRKWISLYKTIRPDIKVVPISTSAVYVHSTALTSKSDNLDSSSHYLGKSQIVNAPRLFLAVNGGSNGACGNNKSCNVTLEYTWLGATMARASRSGAIAMPVYFEADVKFRQPDFDGSISCDFTNGFKTEGRADIKDGAIIYDGDVYNHINYKAIEEGACKYSINKGDAKSAAYYTIKTIYENYMNIKMQRAAKSRSEMDRYHAYIDQELDYHAANSQNKNYDNWSFSTWTKALGTTWGTVVSFVLDEARSFYWHTRVEDSTTSEVVKFTTNIKEENIDKNEKFSFNGFTVLCWKKQGMDSVLSACPSNQNANYKDRADTDLGKSEELCGDTIISTECLDNIKDQEENSVVDQNGVVQGPFA